MKRLTTLTILLLSPLAACAQNEGVLVLKRDFIDNQYTIGRTSGSPITLTGRALNTTTGRQGFYGLSRKESHVLVNSSVTDAFITGTEDELQVRNVTIDGQRYADQDEHEGEADIADGVKLTGIGCTVDNCLIKEFWGSGIVLDNDQYCADNRIQNCFRGIEVVSSDVTVGPKNIVSGCRDEGIYVHGSIGNVHSIGNHYYGHDYAGRVVTAGYWATDDMYADASYGLYLETSASHVDNCTFQHNASANLYMTGPGMLISDCLIDVQRVTNWSEESTNTYGVYFASGADASRFDGGIVNLTTYAHGSSTPTGDAVTGIFCAADQVYIDCNLHDNNTSDVTKGLVISGAVNGVTFKIRTAGAAGFHGATDQIVVVDNAAADSIYGEIWIAGRTSKAINDYVTLPSGWDGQITVYDVDAGGAATVMTGPTAY